jgi:hypothetical protein
MPLCVMWCKGVILRFSPGQLSTFSKNGLYSKHQRTLLNFSKLRPRIKTLSLLCCVHVLVVGQAVEVRRGCVS